MAEKSGETDMLWRVKSIIADFIKSKVFIIKQIALKNRIHPLCTISNSNNIRIGKFNSIKQCKLITNSGTICIANYCWINYDVEICPDKLIKIGNKTTIQKRSTINGNVTIGEECIIAPNVFISSGTHIYNLKPELTIREQEKYAADNSIENQYDKPVTIGNDVWIGVNSVILPGVSIGDHCIIGANAVVTKDVESGKIVAGIPAKVIGLRQKPGA